MDAWLEVEDVSYSTIKASEHRPKQAFIENDATKRVYKSISRKEDCDNCDILLIYKTLLKVFDAPI